MVRKNTWSIHCQSICGRLTRQKNMDPTTHAHIANHTALPKPEATTAVKATVKTTVERKLTSGGRFFWRALEVFGKLTCSAELAFSVSLVSSSALLWCEYSVQLSLDFFDLLHTLHPLSRASGILRWIHRWFCGHRVCFFPNMSSSFTHGAQFLRSGLTLKEMSCNGKRLWSPPTAQELQALWGKDGGGDAPGQLADPPTPWTVMEEFSEKDYLQCLFQKPDEVGWASRWLLFGNGCFGDELFEVPHCNDLQRTKSSELRKKHELDELARCERPGFCFFLTHTMKISW